MILKKDLEEKITILEYQLEILKAVGGRMSNICYNLAQSDKQDKHDRENMDKCRKDWDLALRRGRILNELK